MSEMLSESISNKSYSFFFSFFSLSILQKGIFLFMYSSEFSMRMTSETVLLVFLFSVTHFAEPKSKQKTHILNFQFIYNPFRLELIPYQLDL